VIRKHHPFLGQLLVLASVGRGPEDEDEGLEAVLSEEQIWQVMAYEHQFSHGFKPAEHTDYKP
jgi:hypothetical protein